ncbi:helix-turn-helix domain-containing protein [Streptomyces sp. NPDC051597]|uniref:TetR/AcrR family transcriptional regulator n=1 Tax=Streptomyces sp. NPDC051597 TaxID=3155049 RepID=UPI003428418E
MSRQRTNAERTTATRAQLAGSARQLFTARGYASTTVAEIARSCGLTVGALYHHWPGKEALLVDVVHDIHRELAVRIRSFDTEDDPAALLLHAGRAFLDLCADPATARLLLLDAPAALGYERWRRIDERWWLAPTIRLVERARTVRGTAAVGTCPATGGDTGAEASRQLALALLGALTSLGHEVAVRGAATAVTVGRTYERLLTSVL